MAIDPKGPEEKFLELGERLASHPSSADELYSLLDAIDGHLSRVEQSPSQSMLDALQPIMKALAGKEFLRHSDMDVKVVVASCISEITRITAPDAPYDDDVMKEIFQMIVVAFEGLDDTSSHSFQKRVSILETVAKVRSCVVMLDLECDALILQMFHHFLKTIRADHSENVFSSMETIMSLVIEESEEISSDLLSCLLDTLKNENKEVLPIAQMLAEKVISTCASKIKPSLVELVQSTGAPLSEYNKIIASICQENSDASDHNETHASGEVQADDSKLSERTVSDELPQVSAKLEEEVGCPEKVGAATDVASVEATSNGTVQLGNGDSMEQPSSPKQTSESSRWNGQSKNAVSARADGDSLEAIAVKQDGTTDLKKVKGQKLNSSLQSTDTTGDCRIDSDKDAPVATNRRKGRTKEADSSQVEAFAKEVEPAVSSEYKKNDELLTGPDNPISVASPPPVESPQNSARTKRGRTKEAPVVTNRRKGRTKEADSSQVEAFAKEVEPAVSSEYEKNNEPHTGPDNPISVASPPPVESPQNSARTKRGRPPGSKAAAKHTDVDAVADPPTTASVVKDPSGNSETHDKATEGDDSKKEPEDTDNGEAPTNSTNDTDMKPRRNTGKKRRFKRKTAEQESSSRKQKSNTKQQKEEGTLVKDVDREPSLKEMVSSPKSTSKALRSTSKAPSADQTHVEDSVKPMSRRKRPRKTKDIPETPGHKKEPDQQLVGSKIKVWWPDDEMFYDGVVDSYDPTTKNHKILYADGDIEVLLLEEECWEYVESDSEKDGGKKTAEGSASQMSSSKKAKASSSTVSKQKQAKRQQKSKSGNESSSKDVPRPRGRPRSGTSKLGKLSYDNSVGTTKKSKGPSSDDKARTPRSSGKLKDEPKNESEDKTPRSSSKQEESAITSKNVTSKGGTSKKGNVKDDPSKLVQKSKNETPKASIKVTDEISGGSSKSGDDSSKSKIASGYEVDEVSMNKGVKTKRKKNSTLKSGGDSKANGIPIKGKAKVGKSGTTPSVSDGDAVTTTGGRKRKRKGQK